MSMLCHFGQCKKWAVGEQENRRTLTAPSLSIRDWPRYWPVGGLSCCLVNHSAVPRDWEGVLYGMISTAGTLDGVGWFREE